jgi:hypothetical protein
VSTELPLRIHGTAGGFAVRAPCGAEAAVVRAASATLAPIARAARGLAAPHRGLGPDASNGAVLRMSLHIARCQRCQDLAAVSHG